MRLTMYLLRPGAPSDIEALRNVDRVRELTLEDDAFAGSVFLVEGQVRPPSWATDLARIADLGVDLEALEGRSLGAVILIQSEERVAAVCFGTGFHAIDPALIERGFGLRVAANAVSASKVRGAETRGVASNSRDQKTLLPVDGAFRDLAVEIDEDWLRQLSGKADKSSFATSVAGSDSLRISVGDFSLEGLGEKVAEVIAVYRSTDYQRKFPFLDQITPIDKTDPILPTLDAEVAKMIRAHDDALSFAAPDPFDQGDVDHYEISCGYAGRYTLDDLTPNAVFDVADLLDPKKDPLEAMRVFALDADENFVDRVHSLRSYVQAEVTHGGTDYLLSAGLWFAIRPDFSSTVHAQVGRILDLTTALQLPAWDAAALSKDDSDSTAEGSYNKMLESKHGYALLDKKLVRFGPHERLEIADSLTPGGELLCVKAASSSATLSHLVAQAVNSASAWGDSGYQQMLTQAWTSLHGTGHPALERGKAVFVLAIATTKPGKLSDTLFFFTKVQIANCLKLIERAGFSVALARIDMSNVIPKKVARKPRGKVAFRTGGDS